MPPEPIHTRRAHKDTAADADAEREREAHLGAALISLCCGTRDGTYRVDLKGGGGWVLRGRILAAVKSRRMGW